MTLEQLVREHGLTKIVVTIEKDSEEESNRVIRGLRADAAANGFIVMEPSAKYKRKLDKKTGEITEEKWVTSIKINVCQPEIQEGEPV